MNLEMISAIASVASAIASLITVIGVAIAYCQLKASRNINQLQFEDSFSREYRDLASRIPTKALLGGELTRIERATAFDEFFRYVDLSNEQVSLRRDGRIRRKVWIDWCEGMEANLELPEFKLAWENIKNRTDSFKNLRRLEAENFEQDPKKWSKN